MVLELFIVRAVVLESLAIGKGYLWFRSRCYYPKITVRFYFGIVTK